MSVKNNQQLIIEVLKREGSILSPAEIAEKTDIGKETVRSTVRIMALKGLIENPGHGQYQALPGGEIPDGKKPHIDSSQKDNNKADSNSLNKGVSHDSNPSNTEGTKVELDPNVGYSQVFIPEWIEVYMFDQLVAKVHMSQIIPGATHEVHLAEKVFTRRDNTSQQEPPPQNNEPQKPEG